MIFVIMGKSASGKDNIYKELLKDRRLALEPLVIYTTRPMRAGEENGREYPFTDKAHLDELRDEGRVIEERVYHVFVNGLPDDWYYFTADDGNIRFREKDYLIIGTLESYVKIREYFGKEYVVPLYIECRPENRLMRSIEREKLQENGNYKELCRRFLADEEDFSEEKIAEAGIPFRFSNDGQLCDCIENIRRYIETAKRV